MWVRGASLSPLSSNKGRRPETPGAVRQKVRHTEATRPWSRVEDVVPLIASALAGGGITPGDRHRCGWEQTSILRAPRGGSVRLLKGQVCIQLHEAQTMYKQVHSSKSSHKTGGKVWVWPIPRTWVVKCPWETLGGARIADSHVA